MELRQIYLINQTPGGTCTLCTCGHTAPLLTNEFSTELTGVVLVKERQKLLFSPPYLDPSVTSSYYENTTR
jgi:hypothetical protein